ncbi:Tfp pilus assembly protein PilX [Thiorhodococcus drewsii AZ1]|uniref:Tfp pilus assembly protein PilX n=1 Tax=Thiorhodococcus drewsii AZ1 TaxID=765913 RepID=G2E077_9GAMM|nr:PilX N-terminal domain-containing pilus assembly protein [Thiorhodococcus drewsii]EGV31805.1 Tfp pilus assembly protein PilX [Thiorhodococcus drewsii AZ1]
MFQPTYDRRQHGMVLVTGLIILLVMTVIGVTAMQSVSLDERMAGNVRSRNVAFQAAEGALRKAESQLLQSTAVQNTAKTKTKIGDPARWDGTSSPDETGSFSISGPVESPTYYIGPPYKVNSGGVEWGKGETESRDVYTITSFSKGATDTAIVILQSRFAL